MAGCARPVQVQGIQVPWGAVDDGVAARALCRPRRSDLYTGWRSWAGWLGTTVHADSAGQMIAWSPSERSGRVVARHGGGVHWIDANNGTRSRSRSQSHSRSGDGDGDRGPPRRNAPVDLLRVTAAL